MFNRVLAARDIIELLGPPLGHGPVIAIPGCLPPRDGIVPLKKETRYSNFSLRPPFSNQCLSILTFPNVYFPFIQSMCKISGLWM